MVQVQRGDARAHLVSYVKSESWVCITDPVPEGWVLFNDFLVRPVPESEVFAWAPWKVSK